VKLKAQSFVQDYLVRCIHDLLAALVACTCAHCFEVIISIVTFYLLHYNSLPILFSYLVLLTEHYPICVIAMFMDE
jgi:hypothetical protein